MCLPMYMSARSTSIVVSMLGPRFSCCRCPPAQTRQLRDFFVAEVLTKELAKHVERIMMHPATLFLRLVLFQAFRAVSIIDGPRLFITQYLVGFEQA